MEKMEKKVVKEVKVRGSSGSSRGSYEITVPNILVEMLEGMGKKPLKVRWEIDLENPERAIILFLSEESGSLMTGQEKETVAPEENRDEEQPH